MEDIAKRANSGEAIQAFPDIPEHPEHPGFESTVQFIGAAVSHAELGNSSIVTPHLQAFPDRVLSRNIALYLFGSTKDDAYKALAETIESTGHLKMHDISRAALSAYFDLDAPPKSSAIEELIPRVSPELLRETQKEVFLSLSSYRMLVQDSTGKELVAAKEAYDKELDTSIAKLIAVYDFEFAHEFAAAGLTPHGKEVVQTKYDLLVEQHIGRAHNAAELTEARNLALTLFTPYWRHTAKNAYDRQVLSVLRSLHSADDLQVAIGLAETCLGESGRSESKHVFDAFVLELINKALSTGDIVTAFRLQKELKTYSGKETVQKLLGN